MNTYPKLAPDAMKSMIRTLTQQQAKSRFSRESDQREYMEQNEERWVRTFEEQQEKYQEAIEKEKTYEKIETAGNVAMWGGVGVSLGAAALGLGAAVFPVAMPIALLGFAAKHILGYVAAGHDDPISDPNADLTEQYLKSTSPRERLLQYRDQQENPDYQNASGIRYGDGGITHRAPKPPGI